MYGYKTYIAGTTAGSRCRRDHLVGVRGGVGKEGCLAGVGRAGGIGGLRKEEGCGVVGEGWGLRVAAPWVQCLPESPAGSGHGTRGLTPPRRAGAGR